MANLSGPNKPVALQKPSERENDPLQSDVAYIYRSIQKCYIYRAIFGGGVGGVGGGVCGALPQHHT